MYKGYLKINLNLADGAYPIANENVYVKCESFKNNRGNGDATQIPENINSDVTKERYTYRLITDSSGTTQPISIPTPNPEISLNEYSPLVPYSVSDVYAEVKGYFPVRIKGVQIFPDRLSTLPISLVPISKSFVEQKSGVIEITIPSSTLINNPEIASYKETQTDGIQENGETPFVADYVTIPEYITVHLGTPTQNAENLRVPFTDYIKNVASSEIYPTWHEQALRANIIAIVSLSLNRIFTEWYPSKGYDFDITNSTQFDQSFVKGRNYFENISFLVDELFDTYITRSQAISPLFASYCDGKQVNCDGMHQWGSENLARQGYSALNILKYYYGSNIELKTSTEVLNVSSYPGYPLSIGARGDEVEKLRRQLYRISDNYPLIPKINPILNVFDSSLDTAVRTFQEIFGLVVDGIVGKATWYRISYIYSSVTELSELTGKGETGGIPVDPPTETIGIGDSGGLVAVLQLMLGYIGLFYNEISSPALDGVFGEKTQIALMEFQKYFGLSVTGIVTETDWQKLYEVYRSVIETVTSSLGLQGYPGKPLTIGSSGEYVLAMQNYLNTISTIYTTIPKITPDGIYGANTAEAVRAFQRAFYINPTGVIDSVTWGSIVEAYNFVTKYD